MPQTDCSLGVHDYDVITEEVYCARSGLRISYCLECGDYLKETLPPTGHNTVTDKAVAATLFAAGKTAGSHCSVCGKVLKAQKSTAKLTPTIKLSKKKVKVHHDFYLMVSGLAKGDYVKSVKSSRKSVAKIKANAGLKLYGYDACFDVYAKKKGKAKITVTLASGKKATCVVTVK